jgi:molecular chaperone HtpG
VLFVHDPIDEFVLDRLAGFEKKTLVAAEKADLTLATAEASVGLSDDAARALAGWVKEVLGDRVGEVRVSRRLVDSPAAVLEPDKHLTASMRRVLRQMGREFGEGEVLLDLELNPRHALITGLEGWRRDQPGLATKFAEQLYDSARMASGLLDDPRLMVRRVHELLAELMPKPPSGGTP